jgi:ribosomal protein L11 methylase PrmA
LFSLLLEVPDSEQDATITSLWECGTVGIVEEQARHLRAFFETPDGVAAASELLNAILLEMRIEDPVQSYSDVPEDFAPILIGNRFALTSIGSKTPAPLGRVAIQVDAKSAFGSGRHQSTQLMMQALERHIRDNCVVLDVGCGSGILSLAAQQLGSRRVVACDIDPNAIAVSRKAKGILLFAGSADSLQTAFADLVLANITAAVVDRIAVDLHRVTKPEGHLIVSGFTCERTPEKFHPEGVLEADEWQCWICRRDDLLAQTQPTPHVHLREWW